MKYVVWKKLLIDLLEVLKESKLLELTRSNICEFEGLLTCGGKRYFVTLIDDSNIHT